MVTKKFIIKVKFEQRLLQGERVTQADIHEQSERRLHLRSIPQMSEEQ